TVGDDGRAIVWAVRSQYPTVWLRGHTKAVLGVRFSPDGSHVVTASGDGSVRLWSAATGRPLRTLRSGAQPVMHASDSPDGLRTARATTDRIVTTGDDKIRRTWSLAGVELEELRHPDGEIAVDAAFDRAGTRLVTATMDSSIVRIWDVRDNRSLALVGHLGLI